ncbi:MAG: hypothetical protein IJP92_00640 [Lachnospiraceae bacterium]|nr:hypothetical protein [Lachnospiraceae bacterium]
MTDQTMNRIFDMMESLGAALYPIVIIGAVVSIAVLAWTFLLIVKVIKDIWRDGK